MQISQSYEEQLRECSADQQNTLGKKSKKKSPGKNTSPSKRIVPMKSSSRLYTAPSTLEEKQPVLKTASSVSSVVLSPEPKYTKDTIVLNRRKSVGTSGGGMSIPVAPRKSQLSEEQQRREQIIHSQRDEDLAKFNALPKPVSYDGQLSSSHLPQEIYTRSLASGNNHNNTFERPSTSFERPWSTFHSSIHHEPIHTEQIPTEPYLPELITTQNNTQTRASTSKLQRRTLQEISHLPSIADHHTANIAVGKSYIESRLREKTHRVAELEKLVEAWRPYPLKLSHMQGLLDNKDRMINQQQQQVSVLRIQQQLRGAEGVQLVESLKKREEQVELSERSTGNAEKLAKKQTFQDTNVKQASALALQTVVSLNTEENTSVKAVFQPEEDEKSTKYTSGIQGLESCNQRTSNLNTTSALSRMIQCLKGDYTSKDTAMQDLRAHLTEVVSDYEVLQQQYTSCVISNDQLESELQDVKNTNKTLEKVNHTLDTRVFEQEEKLFILQQQVSVLKPIVEKSTDMQHIVSNQQVRQDEVKQEREQQDAMVAILRSEKQALDSQLREAIQHKTKLHTEQEQLTETHSACNSTIYQQQKKLHSQSQVDSTIKEFQSENDHLKWLLHASNDAETIANERLLQYKEENYSLQKHLEHVTKQLDKNVETSNQKNGLVQIANDALAKIQPYIGLDIATLKKTKGGVSVKGVIPPGPMAIAGLKKGDKITSINGTPVTTKTQLGNIFTTFKLGEKILLGIDRKTLKLHLNVTIGGNGLTPESSYAIRQVAQFDQKMFDIVKVLVEKDIISTNAFLDNVSEAADPLWNDDSDVYYSDQEEEQFA